MLSPLYLQHESHYIETIKTVLNMHIQGLLENNVNAIRSKYLSPALFYNAKKGLSLFRLEEKHRHKLS